MNKYFLFLSIFSILNLGATETNLPGQEPDLRINSPGTDPSNSARPDKSSGPKKAVVPKAAKPGRNGY